MRRILASLVLLLALLPTVLVAQRMIVGGRMSRAGVVPAAVARLDLAFIGAGTADVDISNNSVFPLMPVSHQANNLLVCYVWQRGGVDGTDDTIVAISQGWTEVAHVVASTANSGQVKVFAKIAASDSEATPEFDIQNGEVNEIDGAQCIAIQNADLIEPINVIGDDSANTSAQDIGPIAGITPTTDGSMVVVLGCKSDDWTSVDELSGFTEIGETVGTNGNDSGCVWDYVIQTTATEVEDQTFTVTGGASSVGFGLMFAVQPAEVGTIPEPEPDPLTILTLELPGGIEEEAYHVSNIVCVVGGEPPYTLEIIAGVLPAGISLGTVDDQTGCAPVTGTPADATADTYNLTIEVTDSAESTDTEDYTLVISADVNPPVITTLTLPGGQTGTPYNDGQGLCATSGTTPYAWSLVAGTWPDGLDFGTPSGNCVPLEGTPTQNGTFNVTVRVTDAADETDDQNLSVSIASPPPPADETPLLDGARPRLLFTSDAYSTSEATRSEICTRLMTTRSAQWNITINQLDFLWNDAGLATQLAAARMKVMAFVYQMGQAPQSTATNVCGKLLPSGRTVSDYGTKVKDMVDAIDAGNCTEKVYEPIEFPWLGDGAGGYVSAMPLIYDWIYDLLVAAGIDDDVRAKLFVCSGWQGLGSPYDEDGGAHNQRALLTGLATFGDGSDADKLKSSTLVGLFENGYNGEQYGALYDALSSRGGWTRGYEYMMHGGHPLMAYPRLIEAYRTANLIPKATMYGNPNYQTLIQYLPQQFLYGMTPKQINGTWWMQASTHISSPFPVTNNNRIRHSMAFARLFGIYNSTTWKLADWLFKNRTGTSWNQASTDNLNDIIEGFYLVDDPPAGTPTGPQALGMPRSWFFPGIGIVQAVSSWEDQTATQWGISAPKWIPGGTQTEHLRGNFNITRNGNLIVRDGINARETWGARFGGSIVHFKDTTYPDFTLADANTAGGVVKLTSGNLSLLDFYEADGTTPANHGANADTATTSDYIMFHVTGGSNYEKISDFGNGRVYICRVDVIIDGNSLDCGYNPGSGEVLSSHFPGTSNQDSGGAITTAGLLWRRYTGPRFPVEYDRGSPRGTEGYGGEVCCAAQLVEDAAIDVKGISRTELASGSVDYDYVFADLARGYNSDYGTADGNESKVSDYTRQQIYWGRDSNGIDIFTHYDRIEVPNTKFEKLWKLATVGFATGVSHTQDGSATAVREGRVDYLDGTQVTVTNQSSGGNGKLIWKWLATSATPNIDLRKIGGAGSCPWAQADGLGACDHNREDPWGRQISNGSESTRDKQFGVGYSYLFVPDADVLYNTFAFCGAAGNATGTSVLSSVDCSLLSGSGLEGVRNGTRISVHKMTEANVASGNYLEFPTAGTYKVLWADMPVSTAISFSKGANITSVTSVTAGTNCVTGNCTTTSAQTLYTTVVVGSNGTGSSNRVTVD